MWKIALVDDDRQALQGMRRLIPWEELELEPVGEAMDGEAGFKLIMDRQPDVVITDVYMPVMNGLDMIDMLRREQFQGKIVILSGYSDFEYARQALRLGVDDYLSKPVTIQTLKEVIGRLIASLKERNDKTMEAEELRRKLMLYEPFVEQERIRALLTGSRAAEMPDNAAIGRHPDMPVAETCWYVVLAVEIVRNDRMEGMTPGDWNLFRFAVGNIVKELTVAQGVPGTSLELYGHNMAVLLQPDIGWTEERVSRSAEKLARELIRASADYLRIGLQIGIGTAKRDRKRSAESTEEAFQSLYERRLPPGETVPVFRCSVPKAALPDRSSMLRPIRFYQEMADAIRQLDRTAAGVALTAYCGQLASLPELSAAHLQRTASELWAIFSYTLYDSGIILEDAFPGEDIQRSIRSIIVLEQMSDWITGIVSDICDRFGRSDKLKHKQAVDFMIHYIHEHYAEDIRLADLADKVFISRNYLSTIFRSATGETFNDYVTRVRMEKARRLILESKLMIYEVAEQVGYKNVPYFTTLFKKHTGRNPTDLIKG